MDVVTALEPVTCLDRWVGKHLFMVIMVYKDAAVAVEGLRSHYFTQ